MNQTEFICNLNIYVGSTYTQAHKKQEMRSKDEATANQKTDIMVLANIMTSFEQKTSPDESNLMIIDPDNFSNINLYTSIDVC